MNGVCNIRFFFQAEDGIRYLVRSRGLGDVYKRQDVIGTEHLLLSILKDEDNIATQILNQYGISYEIVIEELEVLKANFRSEAPHNPCLLYTSDAADERSSVDLGGRRIIKKKKKKNHRRRSVTTKTNR